MADYLVIAPTFVNLQISTSKDGAPINEKRFPKDLPIMDLKNKLELITGAGSETMQIELYNADNKLICVLDNDEAMLGAFPVEDNMRLHVTDKFLLQNEIDGMTNVEKFELTDDAYSKRTDTVRQFMMKNKMGQYNEEYNQKKELQKAREKELTESLVVGSRCKVSSRTAPTRVGTIMYKGAIDGLHGFWVGVKYDEPLGKNDGTFEEKKYFDCLPKYGAFVKAVDVEVGDFPEVDDDLDEEI